MSTARFAMRTRWLKLCGFLIVLLVTDSPIIAQAQLPSGDERRIAAVKELVAQAGAHYTSGKYSECGATIEKAQQQLAEAVRIGGEQVLEAANSSLSHIKRAAALLELEGIRVSPLDLQAVLAEAVAKKAEMEARPKPASEPKTKPKPTPTKTAPPPATGVSFTKEVAPILVNQCGRCHVTQAKGNFSMTSFAVLMKGPPEGVVIFPGDTMGSRLIETIVTGDMPRGGGKLPPAQIDLLKRWITEGAKFDGPAPDATLASLVGASGAVPAQPEPATAMRSTGKETVSFSRQVAPLLLNNCNGCHIDAMQNRGGLRMDSLAQLMRGGDSGAVVSPGNGDGSLLVQKLRGQSGDRMPAGGRPALSDNDIQLISTWIKEGATIDEGSADQPLRVLAARAWAKAATPEQLGEKRMELAKKNWGLGSPGIELRSEQTEHFNIMGDAGPKTLEMVATAAEATMKDISSLIRSTGKEAPFRGRITVFVFPKRYGYSEFGKMIESRSIPSDWTGHWHFDGVDAYAATVVGPSDTPESVQNQLAGLLTSVAIAELGDAPRWLSEGIGRMVRARSGGKQSPGLAWDASIPDAMASISKPDEFLQGKLPPEQADVLGYAVAKFLFDRTNKARTDQMLRGLANGKSIEQSIAEAFRAKPQELIGVFAIWQTSQSSRRR